jgi:diguanylate cyclase
VGRWTLLTACYQGAEWHSKGYRFPVAVNTAIEQLRRSDFADEVANALRQSRFDAAHLTLEFSYRCLSEPAAVATLQSLHERGVRLAIDDFSPGHPELSVLADVPIDVVKLDRAFVAANADTAAGAANIHQIVHDARTLALRVIASGVEDAQQRDHLRDEDVDIGQGFHFARPFDVEDIDLFLEDYALFSGRPL